MRLLNLSLNLVPIRVHVWGGLGSQLFGCIVARRISRLFPKRKTHLIFHTSGVTRRTLEVSPQLLSQFRIEIVDDFTESLSDTKNETSPAFAKVKLLITRFLAKFGVLSRLNTEVEFLNLRGFIFDVRGHYSLISLRTEEVVWVLTCLGLSEKQADNNSDVSLHYRLGDLLQISEKGPISDERVNIVLRQVQGSTRLHIFSDSAEDEIAKRIDPTLRFLSLNVEQAHTLKVISECLSCRVFIGTNSKISLWIAIFRQHLLVSGLTYMPKELTRQLEHNLPNTNNQLNILYY